MSEQRTVIGHVQVIIAEVVLVRDENGNALRIELFSEETTDRGLRSVQRVAQDTAQDQPTYEDALGNPVKITGDPETFGDEIRALSLHLQDMAGHPHDRVEIRLRDDTLLPEEYRGKH